MSASSSHHVRLLALLQARRHAELEAQAQAFLRRKPADGRVWHLLGLARMGLGHLSAAREALERARLFVPRDAAVLADLAVCLTALGERVAAADCFSRSLALQPGRADVCANAGRNALERGCYQEAEDFCRRALDLQPIAEAQYNLANALKAQGRAEEALAGYRKVLQLAPSVAEAHCAVAMGYLELGQPQEALACSLRALELKPGLVDAWVNLGSAYSQLGQFAEAEAAYGRALELNPAMAEAHNNLGNALWELGRPEDAIAAYRRALELRSAFAEAHNNLGNALRNLERLDEALEAYRRTIALQPGFVDAYYGAGEALTGLKRPDEAVVMLQRLVERAPGDKAYTRLGVALQAADRIEEAIAAYRHAIEVNSGFADAYYKLGDCLARAGRAHEAVAVLRSGMQHRPDDLDMHSALIFFLNYQDGVSPSMLLEEARRYGAACAARAEPFTSHDNTPDPARCVRVGLVSGDFGEHPVGHFLADVLPHLDAQEIELFVYETYKWKGELNTRLRASSSHWREAASKKVDDKALARLIREDGIDILVDLAGHTGNNRLPVFAWRPAPVQVSWLGYLGTTGLQAMDYVLADPWALPAGEESQFAETPWRLPETYLCFAPPQAEVDVGPVPALANGFVTFGCFNNLSKVTERVIACWARILHANPGSRLYLKSKQLGAADTRDAVALRFGRHDIGAERLIMEGPVPTRADHLRAHQRIDIALDPFPYPGITTTVETLWMGVPVLTLRGDRFLGHQGESILHNAGLTAWISANEDDYVAKATRYANDLAALMELRAGLRQQLLASPVLDGPRFARNLEAAFREMWRQWCAGAYQRRLSGRDQACKGGVSELGRMQ